MQLPLASSTHWTQLSHTRHPFQGLPDNSQGERDQGLSSTVGNLGSFLDCLGKVRPSFPSDAAGWPAHAPGGSLAEREGPRGTESLLDDFYEWGPSVSALQAKGLGKEGWWKDELRGLCAGQSSWEGTAIDPRK